MMTIVNRTRGKSDSAPALFRLLSESALSRAAMDCCAIPLVLLDAQAKGFPFTFANRAFESLFGFGQADILGRPLAGLLFRGDDGLAQRVLSEPARRWELTAWGKDGEGRHIEAAVSALRSADGRISHWVVGLSDQGELERLRAEVESLKSLAASSLGLRGEAGAQPARCTQEPGVEVSAANELNADRHSGRILHQR